MTDNWRPSMYSSRIECDKHHDDGDLGFGRYREWSEA